MSGELPSRIVRSLPRMALVVVLAVFSLIMLFPFFMMVTTSLKTMKEILAPHFAFLPKKVLLHNYVEAMQTGNWLRYFGNSLVIMTSTVAISLVINSMAGFSFSRLHFRARNALFVASLIGLMVPPQVTMVPVYLILKHVPLAGGNDFFGRGGLGWINSYMGLIAPYVAGSFGVFLFRQFYLNFPTSLDDASRIDGLTSFQIYFYHYIPLGKPVFASLIVLKATQTWNDYTWPLIITVSEKMRTVQLGLALYRDQYQTQWNLLMSATTIIVVPLVVLFLIFQKWFVEGIVTTGMKT